MKKRTVIWIILCALAVCCVYVHRCALAVCCVYVHRRVIRALIRHESLPKAPKWHVWCKDRES